MNDQVNTDRALRLESCELCGLTRLTAFPTQEVVRDLYQTDYFRRQSSIGGYVDYAASESMKRESAKRVLSATLNAKSLSMHGMSIFDIGCASGFLLDAARDLGATTFGVEPNPSAAQQAARNGHKVTTGFFPEVLADAAQGAAFDLVTATDVIEHVANPRTSLDFIAGMLRPGGSVAVLTPNWNGPFRALMGTKWPHYKPAEHLWYFTPEALRGLFMRAGFSNVRLIHFWKTMSFGYLAADLSKRTDFIGSMARRLVAVSPPGFEHCLPMYLDEILVTARWMR